MADPNGDIIKLYGVKRLLVTLAKRTTFVIGRDRKILHVERGRSAVNPEGAAQACQLF